MRTDWQKLAEMMDKEIDYSDIPPLDENFFHRARLVGNEQHMQFTLEGLLEDVTEQNLHEEVDTGPAVGQEGW